MYMDGLGGSPRPAMSLNLEPLKDGDAIAGFDFHGGEPPADFDPHLALSVVIEEPERALEGPGLSARAIQARG
jgi:hypothetical protein